MEDERGIIYFNHHTKHLARLVFSLWSLRTIARHAGPVTVLDSGESGGVIERIAADRTLAVQIRRITVEQLRRNTAYVAKAGLWKSSPYETTVLLDADTLVVRDPSPLFEFCESRESGGVVVTRFADWETTGSIVRGRIERWADVSVRADDKRFAKSLSGADLVKKSLESPHAAINTGVVAWSDAAAGFLRDWERLTRAGARLPFTDELAAQLLLRKHRHALASDRFNCSPIYGREQDEAVIWHAHGSKHLERPDGRGTQGDRLWRPVVEEAWRANAGGIREWAPAGDEALAFNMDAVEQAAGMG